MKLAYSQWNNVLQWDACHPASLILEAPEEYLAVVSDLSKQADGLEGKLAISTDAGLLSLEKEALLVRDLWSVDPNQKKLTNGIFKKLIQISQDDYEEKSHDTLRQAAMLLEQIAEDSGLPLTWEEPSNIAPLLKLFDVSIDISDNVLERLLDTVRLFQEFLKTKLLILVGIRPFLRQQELASLSQDYISAGMPLLFVDASGGPMLKNERRLIIDADRCELLLP